MTGSLLAISQEHRKQVSCGADRSEGLLTGTGASNAPSFNVERLGQAGTWGADCCNVKPLNESYRLNMLCENH